MSRRIRHLVLLMKSPYQKLYRHFTAANTLTYLKALPTIVKQYNHTVHSSIQEKPVHVTLDNEYVSKRVFLVHGISTTCPVVTYILTEWNGTSIKGTFYEQDVQKVVLPDEA